MKPAAPVTKLVCDEDRRVDGLILEKGMLFISKDWRLDWRSGWFSHD